VTLPDLKKATITNTKTKDKVQVLFNPEKYTLEQSNQFAEIGIPGLSSPLLQFIRGNIKTLTMELFFDTYEKRPGDKHNPHDDVREKCVDKITKWMEIDSNLHAPPVVIFSWDSLSFTGIIERATKNFTMFLDNGRPVRCTMNVTFKEFTTVEFELKRIPRFSPDRTKLLVLRHGDRLDLLSAREYNDPGQWRDIAAKNNIDNPRLLTPGMEITIPPIR